MSNLTVGHSRCKCPTCGKYFNSIAGFDKHRAGTYADGRVCMGHEQMRAIGMDTNADGYWVTSLMPTGVEYAKQEGEQ